MDGVWKHTKLAISCTNARYPEAVELKLREAQWRHWLGSGDRWAAAGRVISWVSEYHPIRVGIVRAEYL